MLKIDISFIEHTYLDFVQPFTEEEKDKLFTEQYSKFMIDFKSH